MTPPDSLYHQLGSLHKIPSVSMNVEEIFNLKHELPAIHQNDTASQAFSMMDSLE
jgi:hypothetical protein